MILSNVISAIVMITVCSIIPVIWWTISARKQGNFFQWVGLYSPKLKMKIWFLIILLIMYYLFWSFDYTILFDQISIDKMMNSENVAANAYKGMGLASILPAFIECFFVNALGEEILFRGFLCKRFQKKFGKIGGVILQACCFGLMHNILYLVGGLDVSIQVHIVLFAFTAGGALFMGFLNERICNGSIIPSFILHGLGNFLGTILSAF